MAPAWERYEKLHGIVNVRTESVDGGTVTYLDAEGKRHTITGDSVVICGGMKPRMDEAMTFAGTAERFFLIGDCSGACGNLQTCNRDAWSKANML